MGGRVERVVIPYAPRELQREIHRALKRFNVLVCHRRFGKTVLCINQLIRKALENTSGNGRYAYVAPFYKQAKQVAWDYLKHYTEPVPGRGVNESELRIDLPNGARIRLYGADDPDALRGIYLDGVVLDEFADMPPRVWTEVLRPALSDRKGWAIFIGTPKGRNAFWQLYDYAPTDPEWLAAMYKASETGHVEQSELESAKRIMEDAEYEQEYECSFTAAIRGAFYGELLNEAEREGRITKVRFDKHLKVFTCWDLGRTDDTVIWFFQVHRGELRFIDYHESNGQDVAFYAQLLHTKTAEKGYIYDRHYLPHDARPRTLASNRSVAEQLHALNIKPLTIVPQLSVQDGIQAARQMIPRAYFDADACADGLEALRQYQREWDDDRKMFKDKALHNWASHAADAFRTGAVGYAEDNPGLVKKPIDAPMTFNDLINAKPRRSGSEGRI
jgi:hypothetical protein